MSPLLTLAFAITLKQNSNQLMAYKAGINVTDTA